MYQNLLIIPLSISILNGILCSLVTKTTNTYYESERQLFLFVHNTCNDDNFFHEIKQDKRQGWSKSLFLFFGIEMVQIKRGSVVMSHHSNYGARVLSKWGRGQDHLCLMLIELC